jgi:solute carrier family 25 phosphate transporter 3
MAKFVVYERVSEAVYRRVDKSTLSDRAQTGINLGSGLMAGFAAAIVSQPADTMLSKINKTKGEPGEGTVSRLIKIGRELGLRGSFSGIGARLVHVGVITAGQFAIYGNSSITLSTHTLLHSSLAISASPSLIPPIFWLLSMNFPWFC